MPRIFAGAKVCDKEHLFTYKLLGTVTLRDTRYYSAGLACAVVDFETEQFVGLLNPLAFENCAYADIEVFEVFDLAFGLHRSRFPGLDGILFLDSLEAVGLCLDSLVVDFSKSNSGWPIVRPAAGIKVATGDIAPFVVAHAEDAGQFSRS